MIRAAICALALAAQAAHAAPPPELAAGVDEHPGAQVPLDVSFTTARGEHVTLGSLLDRKHPVLLVIAYARCTMLCSLLLRGVTKVVHALPREPGRDYLPIVISLDARETVDEAARRQATLFDDAHRWPYLVGPRASIDAVTGALGFRYAWDPRTEQYAHPAVIFALTPDGRVARYLNGVEFAPADVAAALDDAAAGRIMSTAAADVLRCFHFDPALRRVGARAQQFLRAGALGIFALSFGGIAFLVVWERRLRRRA